MKINGRNNKIKYSWGNRFFSTINAILLGILALLSVLPYINLLAVSFSSTWAVESGKVTFFPIGFTLQNYLSVFTDVSILKAFWISILNTVVGTAFSLLMTVIFAYPLSREEFRLKKACMIMIMITFIFSAPVIPWYLAMRAMGLYDNFAALVIPSALNTFNIVIVRSFFMGTPQALIDSSKVDGCGEIRTLIQVILPISKPVMATVGLMYGVSYWNNYSNPLYLINNRNLYTLQLRLKSLIVDSGQLESMNVLGTLASPQALKMTAIIVATIPILCVYPFLQKYFVTGMTLGAVKE